MKNTRLLLAGLLVLAAGAPRASLVNTINVTTHADENGANSSACSLREAVRSVNTRAPFGGCRAGSAFDENRIVLRPGRYQLALGELEIADDVEIIGSNSQEAANAEVKDPLTGSAPRRFRPDFRDADPDVGETGTWLVSTLGSRIIFATSPLTLRDMVLVGSDDASRAVRSSVQGNGGVIYAANSISLDNVIVRGGSAVGAGLGAGNGGAIYLGGDGTSLSLTDVALEYNSAQGKGGAIAILCAVNLNPYALHSVSLTRTLLRQNSALAGAGAIELCGNSTGIISASTLSGNSSPAGSGAISYAHPSDVGLGSVILSYVTAVEQQGHVLALGGVATVGLTGSLLSAFDTVPRADICLQVHPGVPMMTSTSPSGIANALDADNSCSSLLVPGGTGNVSIPLGTPLATYLVPIQEAADYYPATPSGAPYGLTDYYLPKVVTGSPVLDRGEATEVCIANDQRNLGRKVGSACDIGAVERLQVTARADEGMNSLKTDRLAILDILANDRFGESETTGPYTFAANTAAEPAVVVVNNAGGRCVWRLADAASNAGKLEVSNGGVLAPAEAPVVCSYLVRDSSGAQSAAVATVRVQFKNAPPTAIDDAVLRPVGQGSVSFDPMRNDNDAGDGKYGLEPVRDGSGTIIGYGPGTAWLTLFPLEIQEGPKLGRIVGSDSGLCPGASSVPKTCLAPPLRYEADNAQAPFSDSFTYRVYDAQGEASNTATITVYTDAQDPDKGGGAGSMDLLGGLLLGLLGLRRLRRL